MGLILAGLMEKKFKKDPEHDALPKETGLIWGTIRDYGWERLSSHAQEEIAEWSGVVEVTRDFENCILVFTFPI